ncbi:TlpA family protein disulfide reductase [Silvimonas iriomotensis]|uniref:Thioredoxin n=1 Tax=Silvimonas iriomotensis TaxID=449662 RepID=A0ABQ2PBM1_9NEIS|nr:TlpA disulfide reductase family protein [Silvimonas iriomotensis]GGP22910.1 thioredoxin [Silvimonas iriomotensis]
MKRLYWILPLTAAVLITLFLITSNSSKPAPQFSYTTLQGEKSTSASLKGQVVLVNFWATTCPGCVEEMGNLARLQDQFGKQGYKTLSVAMDYDPAVYVNNFVKQQHMPFIVVHDVSGTVAKSFDNVELTPTSFLIDKNGNIVKKYVGSINEQDLEKEIRKLI